MAGSSIRWLLSGAATCLLVGCGAGTSPAAHASPTPSSTARIVRTTCTEPPVVETGGLTISATALYAGADWTLRLRVAPFKGAGSYAVNLNRKSSVDVFLNSSATASDQSRVTSLLAAAPGVANVGLAPRDPNAPPSVLPIDLRVSVDSGSDIDGVLPTIYKDPAVNPIVTAASLDMNSEPGAPADVTLERDQSVPLHSTAGSVKPAADGHTGSFDIVVDYPFTSDKFHLVGAWNCPVAPPSIGTAGTKLGTPAVTATINGSATSFVPAIVTVRVGQIVEWTVSSTAVPYNVTFAADHDVNSGPLPVGSTWDIRFTRPGTYPYTDTIHPGNNGTVIVAP